jgi:Skp family chaperone for outer membrane proteins
MKKWVVMAVAATAATVMMAQEKTAVVNMVDLVRFHPRRESDRKLMQDTEKEYQEKLDKKRDRFEELRSEYEKIVKEARNPALNEKAKAEAEDKAVKYRDVIVDAERELSQEVQKLRRELGDLDTRLLRVVTGEIRDLLTKYAHEAKISIILDGTTIAYFDAKLDVTDDVLRRMGVDPKVRKEALEKAEKEKDAK